MAKRSKPHISERIAASVFPLPTRDSTGEEDEYNRKRRGRLELRIRKAMVVAEKQGMELMRKRIIEVLYQKWQENKKAVSEGKPELGADNVVGRIERIWWGEMG